MADVPKRASNPKRAERRKRSWQRAQFRNKRNNEKNLAQRDANLAALTALGGTQKSKEIVKTFVIDGKSVTKTFTKTESPSEALRRTRREKGLVLKWADQKAQRAAA